MKAKNKILLLLNTTHCWLCSDLFGLQQVKHLVSDRVVCERCVKEMKGG
jgi:hypothetical protein